MSGKSSNGKWGVAVLLVILVAGGVVYYFIPKAETDYWDQASAVKKSQGKVTWKGQRTGQWTFWWNNGQVKEQGLFGIHELSRESAKVGTWQQWDRDGRLVGECEFKPLLQLNIPALGSSFPTSPDETHSQPTKGYWASFADGGELTRVEIYDVPLRQAGSKGTSNKDYQPIKTLPLKEGESIEGLLEQARRVMGIFAAAQSGNSDAAKSILAKDSTLASFATDEDRLTPLHAAAFAGHSAMVELLLSNGAEVNAKAFGVTPLHRAAAGGHEEVALQLIKAGADVNAKNRIMNTPLHYAAIHANANVARLLLEKGSDPKATNSQGKTPLDLALKEEWRESGNALIAVLRKYTDE